MSDALLEARQASKVFGGGLFDKHVTVALDDFSFTIERRAAARSPPSSAKAAAARPPWRG